MPRRRQRKTGWRPQAERQLRVRSIRRAVPDARKLSRAFIGLALARAEAEAQAQAEAEVKTRAAQRADDSGQQEPGDEVTAGDGAEDGDVGG